MRIISIFFIIVFGISLLFPVLSSRTSEENPTNLNRSNQNNVEVINDIEEPIDDEEIIFYDQEIFSRKLFQKSLPPLPKKQKVIWAFRMAQYDLFL